MSANRRHESCLHRLPNCSCSLHAPAADFRTAARHISLLPSLVLFFEFPNGINQNANTLCRCLLKVTLHSIWMHKCDRRFEKRASNTLGVVSSIKATIRNRIKFTMSSPSLFAKEFPIWAYNNILCSYQNGTLSLKI